MACPENSDVPLLFLSWNSNRLQRENFSSLTLLWTLLSFSFLSPRSSKALSPHRLPIHCHILPRAHLHTCPEQPRLGCAAPRADGTAGGWAGTAQTHWFLPLFAGRSHADTPSCCHPHEARLCREYLCSPAQEPQQGLSVPWLRLLQPARGGGTVVTTTQNPRAGPVQVHSWAPCTRALQSCPCPASQSLWFTGP